MTKRKIRALIMAILIPMSIVSFIIIGIIYPAIASIIGISFVIAIFTFILVFIGYLVFKLFE